MAKSSAKVCVTGCAGFIGYHVTQELLANGHQVSGLDNLNDYYDVNLKRDRLKQIQRHPSFDFEPIDISLATELSQFFKTHDFEYVIHLAAQPGVRYSLQHPEKYGQSNLVGFLNILESCRNHTIKHLIYASSSSVYGANRELPFKTSAPTDHPISLYGATKKANEMMAHSYSSMFGLPTTGLRFFTVYGPWGRPDMAPMLFLKQMFANETLTLHNHGDMMRDFTYITDISKIVAALLPYIPKANPNWESAQSSPESSCAPYRIFNLGHQNPIKLMDFVQSLESVLGKTARKEFVDMPVGNVQHTFSESRAIYDLLGMKLDTRLDESLTHLVDWYQTYYQP